MEGKGKLWSTTLQDAAHIVFETRSLTGLEFAYSLGWLPSEPLTGDYKHCSPRLAFYLVGDETWVWVPTQLVVYHLFIL